MKYCASSAGVIDRNQSATVLGPWTAGLNDGKKRPVMVWLHGGGWTAGSGQEQPAYHGENLSRRGDIGVVSLNHRLNILGYMSLSAYSDQYASAMNVGVLAALEMGARQHREIRRRSRQRAHLRAIGRWRQGEHADVSGS
jgi:hypothetical protein